MFEADLYNKLREAKQNGHEPGFVYDNYICFCQKCNAPMTFLQNNHRIKLSEPTKSLGGLSGGKCVEFV